MSSQFIEKRSISSKSKYSNLARKKEAELYPIRARWIWLDSKCKLKEKIVEWMFPFKFSDYIEEFVDANVTADFSKLPSIFIPSEAKYSLQWLERDDFLAKDLGLTTREIRLAKSIKLEDLPNGWEFVIAGSINIHGWTSFGMEGEQL